VFAMFKKQNGLRSGLDRGRLTNAWVYTRRDVKT
jgi:hypothetical protein